MVYKLITAPTDTAITLAEAKAQLNIETAFTDDDTLITDCIKAATAYIEGIIQGPVVTQTWELQLTDFAGIIELKKTPVASITSVSYYDASNADQVVSNTNYQTDLSSVPARIIFNDSYSIPTPYDRFDAVRVRFVCGVAQAAVPFNIKQVVKLLVAHFYENRTPEVTGSITAKFDLTIEKLLHQNMAYL